MSASTSREPFYIAYRERLEALLLIPVGASDQEIHELIDIGFPCNRVSRLCESGMISSSMRDQIIPYKTS